MYSTILGFDIGGSKIAVVEGNFSAEILQHRTFPIDSDTSPAVIFERMFAIGDEVIATSKAANRVPAAISVSIGGPLDIEQGIIMSPPNLPKWEQIPLKTLLFEHFALPVYIEHDGNAGALAEYIFGAGRGSQNMVFLTLGTGLGAGIILNGKIYRGSTDMAGEVGHIRITEDGPIAYGKMGSWEGVCSGAGLVKLAHQRYPGYWPAEITTRELIQAALDNIPEACNLVEEMGEWLGRGIAILVDILNPEIVVVGTIGVVLGNLVLDPARRIIAEEALPRAAKACQIIPAQLGDSLGDIASLMAAIDGQRK
jgi:glucokinase